MVCPYCHQEMEKGYVENIRDAVLWMPLKSTRHAWDRLTGRPSRGVSFGHTGLLYGSKAIAHYCPKCDIVLIRREDDHDPEVLP